MDPELTPEQKFNAEPPEHMVPRVLREGRSREAIKADLVKLDWSPAAADAFVEKGASDLARYQESPETRAALVEECRKQMVGGFAMATGGLLLTGLGLLFALEGATVWIVFSGAILVGLALCLRGYDRWRLYRRDSLPPDK
jgi:hypothetical protein